MYRLTWTEEEGRRSYTCRSESYGFLRAVQANVGGEVVDEAETTESPGKSRPDEASSTARGQLTLGDRQT